MLSVILFIAVPASNLAAFPRVSYERLWAPARVISLIKKEALTQGVELPVALAIAEIESSFQPHATKWEKHLKTASVGIFQVLHTTAKSEFGFKGSIQDLKRPEVNIPMGVAYISKCNAITLAELACCYQAGFYAKKEFCQNRQAVKNYQVKLEASVEAWRGRLNDL